MLQKYILEKNYIQRTLRSIFLLVFAYQKFQLNFNLFMTAEEDICKMQSTIYERYTVVHISALTYTIRTIAYLFYKLEEISECNFI